MWSSDWVGGGGAGLVVVAEMFEPVVWSLGPSLNVGYKLCAVVPTFTLLTVRDI